MTHDYLAELTAWSGRYASVAGVPARNTPESDPTAKIPSRLFAGPALAMPSGSSAADDNAVVLALGTRADDRLAQLRAGEATSVVLLTATSMGLASCPVTEPLEMAETREAVRSDVFGGSSYPQMLLRVGWAPINADPLPSTPRRELADFVEWMADREQIARVAFRAFTIIAGGLMSPNSQAFCAASLAMRKDRRREAELWRLPAFA